MLKVKSKRDRLVDSLNDIYRMYGNGDINHNDYMTATLKIEEQLKLEDAKL